MRKIVFKLTRVLEYIANFLVLAYFIFAGLAAIWGILLLLKVLLNLIPVSILGV